VRVPHPCLAFLGETELALSEAEGVGILISVPAIHRNYAPSATNHPIHFAPDSKTCITFANLRFRVSSCFAPLIAVAISFLCVDDSKSHRACAFLLFFNSRASSAGASTVRSSSSRSITTSTMSPGLVAELSHNA